MSEQLILPAGALGMGSGANPAMSACAKSDASI